MAGPSGCRRPGPGRVAATRGGRSLTFGAGPRGHSPPVCSLCTLPVGALSRRQPVSAWWGLGHRERCGLAGPTSSRARRERVNAEAEAAALGAGMWELDTRSAAGCGSGIPASTLGFDSENRLWVLFRARCVTAVVASGLRGVEVEVNRDFFLRMTARGLREGTSYRVWKRKSPHFPVLN